jgi:hypothetical protein
VDESLGGGSAMVAMRSDEMRSAVVFMDTTQRPSHGNGRNRVLDRALQTEVNRSLKPGNKEINSKWVKLRVLNFY